MHRHPSSFDPRVIHLALPMLVAAALALPGDDASAQTGGSKDTHIDYAPSPTTPAQAPPAVSRYGRFLVGDSAPDIDLNDQADVRFHLGDARHEKPWLVVFARVPEDVVEVEKGRDGAAALGVGQVVIAPFRRDHVTPLVADPQVRLLYDHANRVARVYGVFDPVTSNPFPGVFLIDRSGKILMLMSGGIPDATELTRMTRDALVRAGQRADEAPPALN
jgi:cytochrome oxidase Cu insertion factor (SCO1/SenC/PrrC family)